MVTALNSVNKKAFGSESVQNSYDAKLLYFQTCLFLKGNMQALAQ